MRALLAALALFVGLVSLPANAEEAEIDTLRAVLAEGPLDLNLFAPSFLAAVPPAQLEPVIQSTKSTIGPVVAISPRGGPSYLVETATHELPAEIVLDADGKIAGLLFRGAVSKGGSVEDVIAEMTALAPQSAVLVTRNGLPLHAAGDAPLAVGSAFKLGVLKALADTIEAGEHAWDEVVTLEASDISLPSGILQGWPVGAPITLHSAAALMISISDNTATDLLMRVVGRDRVEAALGIAPALSTRELFGFKADRELTARYQKADLSGKRDVIAELSTRGVPEINSALPPLDDGVEWYLIPTQLCALIEAVGDLDVTRINPGVANKADWASISFKGGSEVGVLNLTSRVIATDGTRYCVTATWNDSKAIDEAKATGAYASLLARLR